MCKACSDSSPYFADGRALKRHYNDRLLHSVEELTSAGVRLWANVSDLPEDNEALREVY